jgi:hypothetical protein
MATTKKSTTTSNDARTFTPGKAKTHRCAGACGKTLPVVKFPTTTGGRRVSECRECRDARRAAATS